MKKRNRKQEKRIKKLIVACVLSAIILTVSTYAWFIGMQTVSVNAFEVNVAATEGLALSLDGETFSDTVSIDSSNYDIATYATNTNRWTSLEPISTVGKVDSTYSRLVIYEKSSLTASPGGYRLMSKVLNNTTRAKEDESDTTTPEADGYVVFDLFVKNLSGEAYYSENNTANEEAVYLTRESAVTVGSSGTKNTGIENSVRVAFAQIGRVKSDASASTVQGITCTTAGDVIGICRDAAIWEPNDMAHVANAISWYTSSCKKRTGDTITDSESFSGACKSLTNNSYVPTYSVAKEIAQTDNVDVYDGKEYNEYETSVTNGLLQAVDTFRDTEKMYVGANRTEFMTLAPNSITKVRVYVYIEGQDVDNYDFASLGKQISVEFGFTKERYYGEDIDYDNDPALPEELYRNNYVQYDKAQEGDLTLPTGVTYVKEADAEHGQLVIDKTVDSFEFTDNSKTMVATVTEETVTEDDGNSYVKRTWTVSEKQES